MIVFLCLAFAEGRRADTIYQYEAEPLSEQEADRCFDRAMTAFRGLKPGMQLRIHTTISEHSHRLASRLWNDIIQHGTPATGLTIDPRIERASSLRLNATRCENMERAADDEIVLYCPSRDKQHLDAIPLQPVERFTTAPLDALVGDWLTGCSNHAMACPTHWYRIRAYPAGFSTDLFTTAIYSHELRVGSTRHLGVNDPPEKNGDPNASTRRCVIRALFVFVDQFSGYTGKKVDTFAPSR